MSDMQADRVRRKETLAPYRDCVAGGSTVNTRLESQVW